LGKNIQKGNLKIKKEKILESVVAGKIGEKAKLMENNLIEKMEIEKNKIRQSIYELLMGLARYEEVLVTTETENLYLLPATVNLSGAEIELLDVEDREKALQQKIDPKKNDFDFMIIEVCRTPMHHLWHGLPLLLPKECGCATL